MEAFTIVVAIRGTKKEEKFYKKSIKSAINLNPDEIIIAVDYPFPDFWKERVVNVFYELEYHNFRLIEVEKSDEWKFQLAKVVWEVYRASSNDRIYHFDIDSEVRPTILIGLEKIGKDNIAVISFTKRTRLKSIPDLIRYISYRIRIRTASSVFSGNYWVYRPFYYEIISMEASQKIANGIDTLLVEAIYKQDKFKLVTRKEIGVNSFDLQNEEYDWRQFQDGIWYFAHRKTFYDELEVVRKGRGRLYKRPLLFMIIKTLVYLRMNILKGYIWAKNHPNHYAVKKAQELSLHEWNYLGASIVKQIKRFKDTGTGF